MGDTPALHRARPRRHQHQVGRGGTLRPRRLAHARPGPGAAPMTPAAKPSVVPQLASLATEVRDGVTDGPVRQPAAWPCPGCTSPRPAWSSSSPTCPATGRPRPSGAPVAAATGLPTALINDARAFGLAELRFGAGEDVDSFIGLTLGTGVGGCFAIGNQVIQGYRGRAGELGHQTIDPDGPWCGCGNRGCVEAYCRADQVAIACGTARPSRGHREGPRRGRARHRRAGRDRALPGHRHQQRGHHHHARPGHPGRWLVQRRRPAHRAHQGGDAAARPHRLGRAHDVVLAELGTWAGAIGAAVHGAEQAARQRAHRGPAADGHGLRAPLP